MTRKSSKRIPRPVRHLLAPNQLDDLVVQPRLHWQMLLAGHADQQYQLSIINLFNIAGSIAYLADKNSLGDKFKAAQEILIDSMNAAAMPTDDEMQFVGSTLNTADSYLGVQSRETIRDAIAFVKGSYQGQPA